MRTSIRAIGFACVLGVSAGCGGGNPKPAPVALKTTKVEDPVNGYRIAIPEGWVADELPVDDARRRWFAGRWKPTGAALGADGLFVHLMSPGCAAADLGGRYGGAPFASELEPEGFSVIGSSPVSVGTRAAFKIDGKYHSKSLGDLFEATIYIETDPGSGVMVTSRGAPRDEASVRARLEAALVGFDTIKREIRLKPAGPQSGGTSLSVPEGFDVRIGPAAYGTLVYAIGPVDVQARQETISLVLAPPVPAGAQFLAALLADASKGLTRGSPRKMKILGQDVQGVLLSPPDPAPRYEIAVTMFRIGDLSAALCVHAAMIPKSRALDILEAVGASLAYTPPPVPKLEPVRFGESRVRASLLPSGWQARNEEAVLTAKAEEPVAWAPGPDTKKHPEILVEATIEDDTRGNGTPRDAAQGNVGAIKQKKGRVIALDDITLPDGRTGARLVAATQVSYEFMLFARATPGSLAQVHVSSPPGYAPVALKIAEEMLAATNMVALKDLKPPPDAVLDASRKVLPEILEKARSRTPEVLWYIEEAGGKEAGGQQIRIDAGGSWTDRERHSNASVSVESSMKGSPGHYSETVTMKIASAEASKPTVVTTGIDGLEGDVVNVTRKHGEDAEQKAGLAKPELFLAPDLASSDAVLVALASAAPGSYAFVEMNERFLAFKWGEYQVLGEEDVEVPAGKFKARRIETGVRSIFWVADGKVVKAELGEYVRKLCPESQVKKYFQE